MSCRCTETGEPTLEGNLQMRVTVGHVSQRVKTALTACGLPFEVDGQIITVGIDTVGARDRLHDGLTTALTSVERDDIRAVFLAAGTPPSQADYFDVDTLDHHLASLKAGWLRQVLRDGALTSVLQPIVHTGEPSKPFAFEALLRLRVDGALRSAENVFSIAREAHLLPALDRAAREAAIVEGAKYIGDARLFINFTPSSIYDPVSCLAATVALLEKARIPHERVVFEVIESERIADVAHLRNILTYYRDRGFGVALDDLGSGYASLKLLNELRPDYVKLDMELIQGVDRDPYKAAIASKLIEAAQNVDLMVIAEGVETADEFAWVKDRGVPLVQGYYIARPASPPALSSAAR